MRGSSWPSKYHQLALERVSIHYSGNRDCMKNLMPWEMSLANALPNSLRNLQIQRLRPLYLGQQESFLSIRLLGKRLSQSPYLGLFPWCRWRIGWNGRERRAFPPLASSPAGLLLSNVSTLKVGSQTVDVEAWGKPGEGRALDFNDATCQIRCVGRIWVREIQSYLSGKNSRSLHSLWKSLRHWIIFAAILGR